MSRLPFEVEGIRLETGAALYSNNEALRYHGTTTEPPGKRPQSETYGAYSYAWPNSEPRPRVIWDALFYRKSAIV